MIAATDIHWFSGMVLNLHACTTEAELNQRLLPALHERFRAGVSQIEELSFDMSVYRRPLLLGGRELPDGYLAALEDHPIVAQILTRLGVATRTAAVHAAAQFSCGLRLN